MSFDKIFHLTSGLYLNFFNKRGPDNVHTEVRTQRRENENKFENIVNSPRLAANDHQSTGATLQATVHPTSTGTSGQPSMLLLIRLLPRYHFVLRTTHTSCVGCRINTDSMQRHTYPLCWVWTQHRPHAAAAHRQTAEPAKLSCSIRT